MGSAKCLNAFPETVHCTKYMYVAIPTSFLDLNVHVLVFATSRSLARPSLTWNRPDYRWLLDEQEYLITTSNQLSAM